jgi:hypothetical protein
MPGSRAGRPAAQKLRSDSLLEQTVDNCCAVSKSVRTADNDVEKAHDGNRCVSQKLERGYAQMKNEASQAPSGCSRLARRGFLKAAGTSAAGGTVLAAGLGGPVPAALADSTRRQSATAYSSVDNFRVEYTMPTLTFDDSTLQSDLGSVYEAALTNLVGINTAYADSSTYNVAGRVTYPPGTFVRAGGGYPLPQRWTRDASVNTWNATSLIAPVVGRNTLWSVVDHQPDGGLIVQQNDGEWWDQIVWVVSAWDHYLITGDHDFLTDAYNASVNTMATRKSQNFNSALGLFEGPGFMNDGISAYPSPPWEPGIDSSSVLSYPYVDVLMCLSTNCLYYGAYRALANMAQVLGNGSDMVTYQAAAAKLQSDINGSLWRTGAGTYGYLIQGPGSPLAGQLDTSQEGGGLALAVLMGVASSGQAQQLLSNAHWEPHGVVNVWPNFPRFTNGWGRQASLWPMVHSMFGHAAAISGRTDLFARAMTDLAQLVQGSDDHFYEIYNPATGVPDGGWQTDGSGQITQWVSQPDQAWSATGYLRMVYRALFGLSFTTQGLRFAPSLPSGWGSVSMAGVRYRDMTLDITLTGQGSSIRAVTVDGRPHTPLLSAAETGHHTIQITLSAS